jgi:hypothetical protein
MLIWNFAVGTARVCRNSLTAVSRDHLDLHDACYYATFQAREYGQFKVKLYRGWTECQNRGRVEVFSLEDTSFGKQIHETPGPLTKVPSSNHLTKHSSPACLLGTVPIDEQRLVRSRRWPHVHLNSLQQLLSRSFTAGEKTPLHEHFISTLVR